MTTPVAGKDITEVSKGQDIGFPEVLEPVRFKRHDTPTEPDWIIPGLQTGQVGFVTAPGGTGKSFFLIEIALSVASGQTLLPGVSPSASGPVRVLNFEDDDIDMRNRGIAILNHFDLEMPEDLYLHALSGYSMSLLNVDGQVNYPQLEWFKRQCEGMRLVVLDPLSHVHQSDENSATGMSRLVQVLKRVGRETETGILVVHHSSKAATLNGQGNLQQSSRGSSALVDASRLVMTLSKPEETDSYTLEVHWAKLNGHKPIEPYRLKRVTGGVLVPDERRLVELCQRKNNGRRKM